MITVFLDIDTQIDFMFPAGSLYVPGAERIIDTVARLNRHAAASGSRLVSTMDAHLENDPEFRTWPAHCVAGTAVCGRAAVTSAKFFALARRNIGMQARHCRKC